MEKEGADPNEKHDGSSGTPIQVAADSSDSIEMLRLLLESGADPNAEDATRMSAFHEWLSNDSSLETVKLMIKHGADPIKADKVSKWTALHYFACQGTDVTVLDLLLDYTTQGEKADIKRSMMKTLRHCTFFSGGARPPNPS